ncbi:SDR family NAD(P)-dependent oxidoreductase [Nostocoides sp. F2B08]|uniref:SDR family NAD(P)-dependent oxidoreductase n=1 Tax=Nostocoides sp. F2B08 TaxID=2653936 RepID=UPI0012631D6B|nr:SDR family NAD(P)-dependent oxidoreductase [Tetrasphaera sp. F2B08]KAB7745689.1 SDR family NAD(P)-dependent oxidoreductase [Tetrasphaera sp. F2B08]
MTVLQSLSSALDTALDRTVVPGFSTIGYAVRRRLPTWPADPAQDALRGRHIAVTGATSGLGHATVRQLSGLGAHTHLVVRSRPKAEEVAAELPGPSTIWDCDLSDLDSVRRFAREITAAAPPLAGLVHNAGALPATRTESAQGHELTMALHVLGPVLMTELLQPLLAAQQARVVFVTSGGMYAQGLPVRNPDYERGTYTGTNAYARSKRTQVELLPILAERWAPVRVYAMHPGWAETPGVTEQLPTFDKVMGPILRDADGGADTTTWLLASETAPAPGGLWMDRRERPTAYLGRNAPTEDERTRMWEWVVEATGLG